MKEQKNEIIKYTVEYSQIDDLPNIIKKISKNNKNKIYNIEIKKATNVEVYNILKNSNAFINLNNEDVENINIIIEENNEIISIECFIAKMKEYENTYNFLNKNGDLSPLEFIIVAYNYVKNRKYKYFQDVDDGRYFSKISPQGNAELVCVGYAKIFNQLLRMYGINTMEYRFAYQNKNTEESIGHDVNLVYVNDPKYGLDGLYFFDITADSYSRKHIYQRVNSSFKLENNIDFKVDSRLDEVLNGGNFTHFLLTFEQFNEIYKIVTIDDYNLLLYKSENELNDLVMKKLNQSKETYIDKKSIKKDYGFAQRFEEIDHLLFNDEHNITASNNALYNEAFIFHYTLALKKFFGREILGNDAAFFKAIKYVYPTETSIFYTRCIFTKGVKDPGLATYIGKILEEYDGEWRVTSLNLTKKKNAI
jgi:hypothetical protein